MSLAQEEKEALLEKVEPCRMFWDRFYITDEGQVFTDNDETGQSAEEVYQAWLELKENPPAPKLDPTTEWLLDHDEMLLDLALGQEEMKLNQELAMGGEM